MINKKFKTHKEYNRIILLMNLENEQKLAFNKYINKENIFITGPGGTGKTYLIKAIVNDAEKNNKKFKICALTGCAAILLMCGATTLHRFSGIGLATGSVDLVVSRVLKYKSKRKNWENLDLLIIDEVSMLSLKIFNILDKIGRKIKGQPDIPFGGIQIIFSGDFYQLPPIGDDDEEDTQKFCFETPIWYETFSRENHIILKKIYRQNDLKYIKILNNIRVGKITNSTIATLMECVNKKDEDEGEEKDIKPTILLPKRREADKINKIELAKLDSEEYKYDIKKVDEKNQLSKKEWEHEYNYLAENIMAEKQLILKKGALVMCIVNLNMSLNNPIINGSQGIVIDFIENNPVVKFNNGNVELITPHIWKSERFPHIALSQLPLIHAWAITIHKSQGLSIEKGIINLGDDIFECGQIYVALSRIKSLDGLFLTAFNYSKIKINKKVHAFYTSQL